MPVKANGGQIRWGILGCGGEAEQFVSEIQSTAQASNLATTSTSPAVQHSIVAVSSSSIDESRAFADAHAYANADHVEAFGTSTELHAHPSIDAIFIAGPQSTRYQEATSALRGGKAVLVHKPLAITSSEAQELCALAKREKTCWLGFLLRRVEDKKGFLWAADECALGVAKSLSESVKLPWSEAIGVFEALDDLRSNGAIQFPRTSASSATRVSVSSLTMPSDFKSNLPRPAKGRNSLPAPRAGTSSPSLMLNHRPRTSSMDRPFADVGNTSEGEVALSRRRRKDLSPTTSPLNGGQLGLQTVPESGRRMSGASNGEGFLSPTIASENRRLATSALGSPITSSPGAFSVQNGTPGKGSSKVIEQLTTELHASRMALDDARMQLRTSQRTITNLQKTIDETREALSRSRAENETSGQMLARKDRQHQEVLERARKAEGQAKELGKSSREWGARVRKIEAELGEERMVKQRAEMQYDAIAASWKGTRDAWEKEMKELRMTHGDTAKQNRDRLKEIHSQYQQRDEHGKMLSAAVAELQAERTKAAKAVLGPVQELMDELMKHEAHTASQDAGVKEVQDELKRILRLMRSSDQPVPAKKK